MSNEERDRWWAQFAEWGRVEVERRLKPETAEKFADPYNRYATAWLAKLDNEAAARSAASTSEQTDLQRRAASAAERAAAAAEDSAVSARDASASARDANALASDANALSSKAINRSRDANQIAKAALAISAIFSAISTIVAVLALLARTDG